MPPKASTAGQRQTRTLIQAAREAFNASLSVDLEQAAKQKDSLRKWAEATPQKKQEIGTALIDGRLSIKQAQAKLKRSGLGHGRSTLFRWKEAVRTQRVLQTKGRPLTWNPESQSRLAEHAMQAHASRNSTTRKELSSLALAEAKQSLTDRGVSSLGAKKPSKKQIAKVVSKTLKMVKPQITTQARWIACRCIRNAISLYVICRLVFYDSVANMWIQGCNKWNFDMTTIRFGFTTKQLTVAISRTFTKYREVEIVGSKTATLPHAIKLASLQSAGGVAGDIILLFKVQTAWFGKAIRSLAAHLCAASPLEGSKEHKKFAATTLLLTAQVKKCWITALLKIKPLLSRCVIAADVDIDLVILPDIVFIRVPIPGLTTSLGSGRPGFLYLTTKPASPAMYEVLMMKHHLPTIKRVRDTALSIYPRSAELFISLVVVYHIRLCVCSDDPRYISPERSFLSMDGEPASLGVIFNEPILAALQTQQTEAVVGSANATRIQNACDAGGVFFSIKTRLRSGCYEDQQDPAVVQFLSDMFRFLPIGIPLATRVQLSDFLAMSTHHLWIPAHSAHNIISGWTKTGLHQHNKNGEDSISFDIMLNNLGADVNKSFTPADEVAIRASLSLLEPVGALEGQLPEEAMTALHIPLGAVLEFELGDDKQALRPPIDERSESQSRVTWLTCAATIARREAKKAEKIAKEAANQDRLDAKAITLAEKKQNTIHIAKARELGRKRKNIVDRTCVTCVVSQQALKEQNAILTFKQCPHCELWWCAECKPRPFKTHEVACGQVKRRKSV